MKEDKLLVSVLVPAYNHEKFVEQTILSIVHQTYGYENIELIVIDDCSTDSTGKILKKMADEFHFTFIQNEVNKGIVSNANVLNKMAKGKYVSGCASDDFWHPEKIAKQVELMESLTDDFVICHTRAYIIDEKEKFLFYQANGINFTGDIMPEILIRNGIVAPSVMKRREIYEKIGYHDEELSFEDREMWIRISRNGYKFAYIDQPLVYRRHHVGNLGRNLSENYDTLQKIFNKHKNLYEEYNMVEEYHYTMFIIALKFNYKFAKKHFKQARKLLIKRFPIRSLIALFIPHFFFSSTLIIKIKKVFKIW